VKQALPIIIALAIGAKLVAVFTGYLCPNGSYRVSNGGVPFYTCK
jgi:hypothetical protein